MSLKVVGVVAGLVGGLVAERFFSPKFSLVASSFTLEIPRLYGAVVLVNVVGSAFVLSVLGFKAASARKTFKDKALKDGDSDAEARFSYPKLYAEGFSKHAQDYNCAQRAHQQALETYTPFVACSLIGGLGFPVLSTIGGLLWIVARLKWAEGYSTGDPAARYKHSPLWSYHIWTSLLIELFAATGTAVIFFLGL